MSHCRRILDKTVVLFDELPMKIHRKELWGDVEYTLFTLSGGVDHARRRATRSGARSNAL